jgi:hypothetical protein
MAEEPGLQASDLIFEKTQVPLWEEFAALSFLQ